MSLEILGIAIGCVVFGYIFGSRSAAKEVGLSSPPKEQKADAYKKLFTAFLDADRALLNAYKEELTSSQIPEEIKELFVNSLDTLIRTFYITRFMLPQPVIDAMEVFLRGRLGISWEERLDELRRVQDFVYSSARKDIGTDL